MALPPNHRKLATLQWFSQREGWVQPRVWAASEGLYPLRAAYSYLFRLSRFGLLERGLLANRIVYRISDTGRKRITWLLQNL